MSKTWFEETWKWAESNCLILDTETTGLDYDSEVCQIGIIDQSGDVLMDVLIRPTHPIPAGAARVHGITNEMVVDSPSFADVYEGLKEILNGRPVFVYNAPYDIARLQASCRAYELEDLTTACFWHDVLAPYSVLWGDWRGWHSSSYTWQKLTAACRQQGIVVDDAHAAVGDCKMTLALMKKLGNHDGLFATF